MLKFRGASNNKLMNKKKLEEYGKSHGLIIEFAPPPVFGVGSFALPLQIITLIVAFNFVYLDFQNINLNDVYRNVYIIFATVPTFYISHLVSYKYFDRHRLAPIAQLVCEFYFYLLYAIIAAWVLYLVVRTLLR